MTRKVNPYGAVPPKRRSAAGSISAKAVGALLREKHAKDVFVGECKDGPTWFGSHARLDAWAMLRTWSPPTTIGYEIKVSRSDWLKDQKIASYLPLCHRLYIVAPDGVVSDGELPEHAGMLRVTKGGGRLITVKKAPYRSIEWPGDLMAYVLMSRATIDAPREPTNLDGWRRWLEQRAEERKIGHQVSAALKYKYATDVEVVRHENDSLKRRVESVDGFLSLFKQRTGHEFHHYDGYRDRQLKEVVDGGGIVVPSDRLGRIKAELADALMMIEQAMEQETGR